jgi:hypothetical protein
MHNGQRLHLGSFATLEEAAAMRMDAAEELHGRFVHHG